MPISVAHNGAVSDRSKLAVTFTIDHVIVEAYDISNSLISQNVTNGGTAGLGSGPSPALPLAVVGEDNGGRMELALAITVSNTGGSKRATGGGLVLAMANEISNGSPGQVINMLSHHENPEHPIAQGDLTGSIGYFQDARDGTWGWDGPYAAPYPRPGGANLVGGQQTTTLGSSDILRIQPEEITEGGALESIGQFRIERESLYVYDEKTGAYMVGPSDNFTFNIRIIP